MKKNKLDLVHPLIYDLLKRESDPGEIQVCPNCDGRLHVVIRIYTSEPIKISGELVKSIWDKYLGVGVHCDGCKLTAFLHFTEDCFPPWAKESEYKDMNIDEAWKLLRKDSEEK